MWKGKADAERGRMRAVTDPWGHEPLPLVELLGRAQRLKREKVELQLTTEEYEERLRRILAQI